MAAIQHIGTEHPALPVAAVRGSGPSPQAAQPSRSIPDAGGKEYVVELSGESLDFVSLQARKSGANEAAERIRTEYESLMKLDDYISRMKASLGRIVKNFPPFPPGSEERTQLLMNYSAFRHLIDQLTLPPPEKEGQG